MPRFHAKNDFLNIFQIAIESFLITVLDWNFQHKHVLTRNSNLKSVFDEKKEKISMTTIRERCIEIISDCGNIKQNYFVSTLEFEPPWGQKHVLPKESWKQRDFFWKESKFTCFLYVFFVFFLRSFDIE